MKIYICTDHDIHWPVGGASIVLAKNEDQAKALLDVELVKRGLSAWAEYPYTLRELDLGKAQAVILADGNY